MAKNTPSFQFYPQDFLGGCMTLKPVDVAVYIKVLCVLWIQGNQFPEDLEQLAMAAGLPNKVLESSWDTVKNKLDINDGVISHARFSKTISDREKKQDAGRKGGKQTQSSRPQAGCLESASPEGVKQNASTALKNEDRSMKNEDRSLDDEKEVVDDDSSESFAYPDDFEAEWKTYPKRGRVEKRESLVEWRKATKAAGAETVSVAIAAFASSPKGRSEFVPAFKRWLKQARWEDDPGAWEQDESAKLSAGEITARTDF